MIGKAGLQRGVGVALWRQIADGIRRSIADGLADENGRLPPEAQLAERFGVNRHTVRAAIAVLAQEGVVQSEQGRGTYVRRQKRLVYPIGRRTRFSAGLAGQAHERGTVLTGQVIEAADGPRAQALGLSEGHPLIRLETLGRADGTAVSRATSWFDAQRFPTIAEVYGRLGSITSALGALGVPDYTRAWTKVQAHHADEADMRALELSPGAIVLHATALNVDDSGEPIQYSVTRFSADRVELLIGTPG